MLHFRSEVVGEERVKDFSFPSKHGVIGDPTKATEEQGEELTTRIVDWIENWINKNSKREGVHHNW